MKTWMFVVIGILVFAGGAVLLCFLIGPCKNDPVKEVRKVAILVSTDASYFKILGNAGYWNDTVLTYCMLRRNGFTDENIYVIYGDGHDGFYVRKESVEGLNAQSQDEDPPLSGGYYEYPYCNPTSFEASRNPNRPVQEITDFPFTFETDTFKNSKCETRPQQVLECLATGCKNPKNTLNYAGYDGGAIEPLERDDFLYFWWRGHGSIYTENGQMGLNLALGSGLDSIHASEIIDSMSKIQAQKRLMVFDTCESGCIAHDVNTVRPPSIVFTSSTCQEDSTGLFTPPGGVPHALWTYWIDGSLMGGLPEPSQSGFNGVNSIVSTSKFSVGNTLDICFDQAVNLVGFTKKAGGQNPTLIDSIDLSRTTRIDVVDPTGYTEPQAPQPETEDFAGNP